MERKYVVKQEKGSNVWNVAIKVAESLGIKSPSIDFADRNGWCDDNVFDVNLIDRYWQVEICTYRGNVLTKSKPGADRYKFEIEHENIEVEVCISEMFLIP